MKQVDRYFDKTTFVFNVRKSLITGSNFSDLLIKYN